MSQPVEPVRHLSSWAKYLRAAQARPGWSVARMERESRALGKLISKATIFRMMNDQTENVSMQRVLTIAEILGDDPETALKAASDLLAGDTTAEPDPGLEGLDPDDRVLRRINEGPWDDAMKSMMLSRLRYRRAQEREASLQRELEEIEQAEEIWRRSEGAA